MPAVIARQSCAAIPWMVMLVAVLSVWNACIALEAREGSVAMVAVRRAWLGKRAKRDCWISTAVECGVFLRWRGMGCTTTYQTCHSSSFSCTTTSCYPMHTRNNSTHTHTHSRVRDRTVSERSKTKTTKRVFKRSHHSPEDGR